MSPWRRLRLGIKRAMDVAVAGAVLVVLGPILAWIAVAILASSGRPILFRHRRPGLHGRPFTMLKFRTMREPRRGEDRYLTDADRLTAIGAFLRRTSLDELPELWNVLRGEMSLVGPRPLLMEYLETYTPEERRRHDMRPGVTGWAVVNGRNTVRFDDRLRMDVWYVDHWSLRLDLRILVATARQVVRGEGAVEAEDLSLGFRLPARGRTAGSDGDGDVGTPAV